MALTKIGATLGGSADVITVTQNSHGLTLGYPVKMTSGGYAHATADSAANAEVVGIIIATTTNTLTIALGGRITVDGCVPNVTAGTVLFLQVSAGLLAATEPSSAGQISKPMAVVTVANSEMIMVQQRGEVISTGAATIADDAITTAKILNDAVTADKLANSINTEIAANTAKVTNATHTGDVTGATSLTIANGAVDIAHLSASGSAGSGTFLRGDNAWAAVSSAVTRKGGDTGEESETGTAEADIMAIASLSIAATSPWNMTSLWRKGSGAASAGSGGLKIVADSTVTIGASTTAATLWQSGTANQAEDGGSDTVVGAKATNYLTSNSQNDIVSRNSSSGAFTYGNVGTLTKDAIFPLGTIQSIVLTASNGASNMATYCDEVHVYSWAVS